MTADVKAAYERGWRDAREAAARFHEERARRDDEYAAAAERYGGSKDALVRAARDRRDARAIRALEPPAACWTCAGNGWRMERDIDTDAHRAKCPRCDGTGRATTAPAAAAPCGLCGITGYITVTTAYGRESSPCPCRYKEPTP